MKNCKVSFDSCKHNDCSIICNNTSEFTFLSNILDIVERSDEWGQSGLDQGGYDGFPIILHTRTHTYSPIDYATGNEYTVDDFIADGDMPISYYDLPYDVKKFAKDNVKKIEGLDKDEWDYIVECSCKSYIFNKNGTIIQKSPATIFCIDLTIDGEEFKSCQGVWER